MNELSDEAKQLLEQQIAMARESVADENIAYTAVELEAALRLIDQETDIDVNV